jgi:hypothetical protein
MPLSGIQRISRKAAKTQRNTDLAWVPIEKTDTREKFAAVCWWADRRIAFSIREAAFIRGFASCLHFGI